MRLITSPQIVAALVNRQSGPIRDGLPPWLFYALPASCIGDAPIYTWDQYRDDRKRLVFPLKLDKERYFYTGGDVSKRFYEKQWLSDIDVWTTDETLRVVDYEKQKEETGYDWDFVVKSDRKVPTQRCIERFDLSVVQQGFLECSIGGGPVFYATPLAIYSYRARKLLIFVNPLFLRNYEEEEILTEEHLYVDDMIRHWIDAHAERKHREKDLELSWYLPALTESELTPLAYRSLCFEENEFFENCELCLASLMEKNEGYDDSHVHREEVQEYLLGNNQSERMKKLLRWTTRIMKYRNRFPDFDSLYLINPFVERELVALRVAHEKKKKKNTEIINNVARLPGTDVVDFIRYDLEFILC